MAHLKPLNFLNPISSTKLDFFNSWRYFFYYCENVLLRTRHSFMGFFFFHFFYVSTKFFLLLPFLLTLHFSLPRKRAFTPHKTGRENLINFYRHEFYIFKYFVCVNFYLIHRSRANSSSTGLRVWETHN